MRVIQYVYGKSWNIHSITEKLHTKHLFQYRLLLSYYLVDSDSWSGHRGCIMLCQSNDLNYSWFVLLCHLCVRWCSSVMLILFYWFKHEILPAGELRRRADWSGTFFQNKFHFLFCGILDWFSVDLFGECTLFDQISKFCMQSSNLALGNVDCYFPTKH